MHVIQIKNACSEHCTDVSRIEGLLSQLSFTCDDEDVLRISFLGVKSLTPSCASSIALQVDKLKSRFKNLKVKFTDLTSNISKTLDFCLKNGVKI